MGKVTDTGMEVVNIRDKNTFYELYKKYFAPLCVYVRTFDIIREDAEDIVQDAFLKLYDTKNIYPNEGAIRVFLYTVVQNRSLNYLRGEKRRGKREKFVYSAMEPEPAAILSIVENEVYREMAALIDMLPFQCKKIFLKVLEGKTSEEIAKEMNLSVETVKTQRKKAKKFLKDKFSIFY